MALKLYNSVKSVKKCKILMVKRFQSIFIYMKKLYRKNWWGPFLPPQPHSSILSSVHTFICIFLFWDSVSLFLVWYLSNYFGVFCFLRVKKFETLFSCFSSFCFSYKMLLVILYNFFDRVSVEMLHCD